MAWRIHDHVIKGEIDNRRRGHVIGRIWLAGLKEADARTEKYGELLEKYGDHPNCDEIVDREMGWDETDDPFDSDEDEPFEDSAGLDAIEEPKPNPATEGVDWVRDKDGHCRHPLSVRVSGLRRDLWQLCKEHGHLDESGDPDVRQMLFEFQTTGAKLAGAPNHLAWRTDYTWERGSVVARLKRALNYLHLSMNAAAKTAEKNVLPAARLAAFRQEQFEVREEILALMKRFREAQ